MDVTCGEALWKSIVFFIYIFFSFFRHAGCDRTIIAYFWERDVISRAKMVDSLL